jgi:flavin-dependent dehydrogenase
MKIECDVLVVGGGPAGLSAALHLSNKNLSIVVIEKEKNCGPKQTKYDITEGNRIKEVLNKIDIKPNKTSSRSEWISPNNNFILDSNIEDYYFKRGQSSDSLEQQLLNKLTQRNVDTYFNSEITSIEKNGQDVKTIKILANNRELKIQSKYIVIADGHSSNFRKLLNIKTNIFSTFIGYGVLVESKIKDIIPHAKIYFNKNFAPGGYVYSGSVGNESFFCVVSDEKITQQSILKQNLELFLEELTDHKFTEINIFSGVGESGIQEVVIGNAIFIGGAALFYDPFLGYGLSYSLESAYYAAEAIEQQNLEIYKKYANEVQEEIKYMQFARDIWRKADNEYFDLLIKAFNGEYDGKDENIWKILKLFDAD